MFIVTNHKHNIQNNSFHLTKYIICSIFNEWQLVLFEIVTAYILVKFILKYD